MTVEDDSGGATGFGIVFKKTGGSPSSSPDTEQGKQWKVGALKPKSVPNRGPEFLSQLAKDIATNLVFTDQHIRDGELDNLRSIFMPIALGGFAECTKEYVKDIGMFYEYYDKAAPRSVNGYPCFFSVRLLSIHDTKIVFEKVNKIRDIMETV